MVSLKQVTQVTVSSPWSSFATSKPAMGRGSIYNPTYPIFIFDYQTGQIAVGYVVGTTAGTFSSQADANFLTVPSIYFTPLGYNYAFGGGGECSTPGCVQNGADACGYWWAIVDLQNNALNTYCTGILPSMPLATHFQSVMIDFVNGNLLMVTNTINFCHIFVFIIPLTCLSAVLNNTQPSKLQYVYMAPQTIPSGISAYTNQAIIFNGYFVQSYTNGTNTCLLYTS